MIYTKLKAQRTLIGKNREAFLVSILPYILRAAGLCINFNLLKFLIYNSDFPLPVKILIPVFSFCLFFFSATAMTVICENYFYKKAENCFVPVNLSDIFCALGVKILKTFLFFTWSAILFTPCAVLFYCAYILHRDGYPQNMVTVMLLSAAVTSFVGGGCFFVIWGRYSKTSFVQFRKNEKNPVRALAQSVILTEHSLLRYAVFRLSFIGWTLLSFLIFPIIYVLPYRKCAKYVFFSEKADKRNSHTVINEKPVVFIFG